jgi:hypothetical protein
VNLGQLAADNDAPIRIELRDIPQRFDHPVRSLVENQRAGFVHELFEHLSPGGTSGR